jgi:hypothetical protein
VTLPLPPRPTDRSTVWLFLVLALWMGVLTWMLVTAAAARSQARPAPEALLARLTAHEAGLESPADAVLIDEVLRGIVERDGVSYSRAVELASPRWSRCAVRRVWTCHLRADGERPRGWTAASWDVHRPRWLELLAWCERVVRGEVPSVCVEPARVWGSRADVLRGQRRGSTWRDAGCVGAANRGGAWI